eukprot:28484_5
MSLLLNLKSSVMLTFSSMWLMSVDTVNLKILPINVLRSASSSNLGAGSGLTSKEIQRCVDENCGMPASAPAQKMCPACCGVHSSTRRSCDSGAFCT